LNSREEDELNGKQRRKASKVKCDWTPWTPCVRLSISVPIVFKHCGSRALPTIDSHRENITLRIVEQEKKDFPIENFI